MRRKLPGQPGQISGLALIGIGAVVTVAALATIYLITRTDPDPQSGRLAAFIFIGPLMILVGIPVAIRDWIRKRAAARARVDVHKTND